MRLFEAVYRHLRNQAPITALVGAGAAARIYDTYAEQERATNWPAIVIEEVDDDRIHQFGAIPSATERSLRLTCLAQGSPKAANDLADLVYAALMGQEAAITASAGSLTVKAVHSEGRDTQYEMDLEENAKLFSCAVEFRFIHDV